MFLVKKSMTFKYFHGGIAKFFGDPDRIDIMNDIILGQQYHTPVFGPKGIAVTVFKKVSQDHFIIIDFVLFPT